MRDLKYQGEEPIWAKFDFMERHRSDEEYHEFDPTNAFSLRKEIDRLKIEKRDLLMELTRAQSLLKILVDDDKTHRLDY